MPTPTKGRRMGGSPAHQRHMMANLATALFEHGKITTTEARARRLRPVAERLITFAKRGDLHARRKVLATVTDRNVVHTLFSEIGPSFASREGGYTRITKIGPRKGDNAPLAVIELVPQETETQSRRRRARRGQPATARPRRSQAEATAPAEAEATDQEPERAATDEPADQADSTEALAEDAGSTEAEASAEATDEAEAGEDDESDDDESDDSESDDDEPEDASQ